MAEELVIRPPASVRVGSGIVSVLFTGLGAVFVMNAARAGWSALVFMVIWLSAAVFIGVTSQIRRVRTSGDSLHVRNFLRDHILRRSEIDCFFYVDPVVLRKATSPKLFGRRAVVKLKDGRTVPLAAADRGPLGQAQLDQYFRILNGWLGAPDL